MKQENGKQIPEAGDIWKCINFEKDLLRIISASDEFVFVISSARCNISFIPGDFNKICTYIGRAKHPLSTIFEVEE